MWRKRMVVFLFLFFTSFFILIGRLMQIQLFETEHFSSHNINLLEESVEQRSQEMVIDNGRGNFLDQNGQSLTQQTKKVLILFPFLKNMDWDSKKVSLITGISESSLKRAIENTKEPIVFGRRDPVELTSSQMEKINDLKIPGVFAVDKKYNLTKNLAEQLIGIAGENDQVLKSRYPGKEFSSRTLVGLTGLEKSFDEFLLSEGKSKLVYHVDAMGGPLFGINVKYVEPANPFYPINIKTTIDRGLQSIAEEQVKGHGIQKGGLVLLDIKTNSVLAMVSVPEINKYTPFQKDTGGIENLMLKQQILGSVFKTVVSAAAIDHHLDQPSRTFDCSKKINGEQDVTYQYGNLTFTDSFAKSCNNTFATLAKELKEIDPNLIEEYAKKLSLVGQAGWNGDIYHIQDFKQLADEDSGRVFLSEEAKKDDNYVAMTGIGQHEVRVTPLSVANMMATIARGGEKEMVRIASTIEYKNGNSIIKFDEKQLDGETISPFTAMKLQSLLREVVTNKEGTGRWFQDLPYEVAGKSGTAETGVFKEGQQLHNKWFAGYFPYKNPRYALVVVNLGVEGQQGGINPLFADMVKELYNYDQRQNNSFSSVE
ncbi:penicillin-binding protein 2 [Bacillus sp. 03113]|uniref:peptidoglycan D,D-transpeptidase FtsI family protein n=1 Tax=Bacillus sp. 03113 TaxID=2578211 RepID=UPI00114488BD|nr:penicillin-binding transpeptidase domain-containing protein [Bacillus sp. 03113]